MPFPRITAPGPKQDQVWGEPTAGPAWRQSSSSFLREDKRVCWEPVAALQHVCGVIRAGLTVAGYFWSTPINGRQRIDPSWSGSWQHRKSARLLDYIVGASR